MNHDQLEAWADQWLADNPAGPDDPAVLTQSQLKWRTSREVRYFDDDELDKLMITRR